MSTSPPAKKARTTVPPATDKPPAAAEKDEFDEFDVDDDDLLRAAEESEHSTSQDTKPSQEPKPSQESKSPMPQKTAPKTAMPSVTTKKPVAPAMGIPTVPAGVGFGGLPNDRLALERATMDSEWFSRLAPAMRTDTFSRLKAFLEAEERAGKTMYPPAPLIHSWSRLTPLSKVKVVIVGQDPYHQPGQACGLSFSVPHGKAVPASLQNIYKEIGSEFPEFKRPNHGCLDGWARQGVLMLNACLVRRC